MESFIRKCIHISKRDLFSWNHVENKKKSWGMYEMGIIACLVSTIASVFILVAQPAQADSNWKRLDGFSDSASVMGRELAKKVVPRLKIEGSHVVFSDMKKCNLAIQSGKCTYDKETKKENCYPNEEITWGWCSEFFNSFERYLLQRNIRFLSEAKKKAIREKIADEAGYQYSSKQVDITKAVELGKQEAFKAFVTLEVNGDGDSSIRTTARSINIKKAVVSVSEEVKFTFKVMKSKSLGIYAKGATWITLGLLGALACHGMGFEASDSADKYYDSYKSATTTEEATEYREKAETKDEAADSYHLGAFLGWGAFAYGIHYLSNEYVNEGLHYQRKDFSHDGSVLSPSSFAGAKRLWISPVMDTRGPAIGLSWNFN